MIVERIAEWLANFLDAFFGSEKPDDNRRRIVCPNCAGNGYIMNRGEAVQCPRCDSAGELTEGSE